MTNMDGITVLITKITLDGVSTCEEHATNYVAIFSDRGGPMFLYKLFIKALLYKL